MQQIYKAYFDCRKSKRNTINALKFEFNLENNLHELLKELNNRTYNPARSVCFAVLEPTPREIFAADFKDRIVHHLLINEIGEIFEKKFIFDSCSCRKNKGTHFCIDRLKNFIKKITKNYTKRTYYYQLDISGFFMSIDKQILYNLIESRIKKEKTAKKWENKILWLSKKIIFNEPTENCIYKGNKNLLKLIPDRKSLFKAREGKGLPIGNYSSQFFANIYLNELDQFIKRKLKCKYYVRYVDDIILLSKSRKELRLWKNKIDIFLQKNLLLKLNPKKQIFQSVDKGVDFLGYFIKPKYNLVRKRVKKNLKRKLYFYKKLLNYNNPDDKLLKKILSSINSYYGHFKHANSFRLRKHLHENHFGILKKFFIPANKEFTHFKINKIK